MTSRSLPKSSLVAIVFSLAIMSGCATLPPERGPAPRSPVALTPQWRASTGSRARTLEVFVENHASSPLPRFSLSIDGIPLPHVPPERSKAGSPQTPIWWRVSPSGAIPPGGHAVVALCFTNAPAPFTLSLDGNGERLAAISVPAPAPPRRRICDVAFAPRGPEVFIKVESSGVPVSSLSLDGVGTPFDVLRDGRVGRPFVLAANTEVSVTKFVIFYIKFKWQVKRRHLRRR